MGEAPQCIELSDIPVKCTGIKPGVKPPLLLRLDATTQRAIWQTVRQHSLFAAVILPLLFVLGKWCCNWRNIMWQYKTPNFSLNFPQLVCKHTVWRKTYMSFGNKMFYLFRFIQLRLLFSTTQTSTKLAQHSLHQYQYTS